MLEFTPGFLRHTWLSLASSLLCIEFFFKCTVLRIQSPFQQFSLLCTQVPRDVCFSLQPEKNRICVFLARPLFPVLKQAVHPLLLLMPTHRKNNVVYIFFLCCKRSNSDQCTEAANKARRLTLIIRRSSNISRNRLSSLYTRP